MWGVTVSSGGVSMMLIMVLTALGADQIYKISHLTPVGSSLL